MSDAETELLGYELSHDPQRLTHYRADRARTMAALATLQDKLALPAGVLNDTTLHTGLVARQRLAVGQWWVYARSAEQAVLRGDTIDVRRGHALSDSFRQVNAALGEHLTTERDEARSSAQTTAAKGTTATIAATLAALLVAFVLGRRTARSVSAPLAELRDTMNRQREGEPGARAREDQGAQEIRSLAVDFNALSEYAADMRARMASLADASLAFGQELSLEALLTRIVQSACEVLGARYAALGVLDATRTGLSDFVTAGLGPEERAAIGELPQGRGLLGVLMRDPRALRLEHMADDPRSVGFPPHHPPMDSFLGVPITLRGEVLGNLYLTDKAGGPFTAEGEKMALTFALQAAVAVDNVRRYEAERRRANELEIMQQAQAHSLRMHELTLEIERAIRTVPDPQEALDILCVALGEGLGVDRVMATTVDADHTLLLAAQWHLPDLLPVGDMSDDLVAHVGGLAEELWSSSGFIARNDFLAAQVQSRGPARIFRREIGARAVIMVPIGLGDRVVGVISVITVHEPRGWTESEISAVQQVAGFMARVIVEADHRAQQSEYIDRLEQLDRQKTDFLSTVSHELRTPLTSISGYMELLQDGDAGELAGEQHRMLEVVDRNTSRLRSLIEDLLVLNRIESGGLKLNVVEVSMRELITRIGEEMSPLAHAVAVELDIDAGPEAAIVQGDRGHLQRTVVNIVSNAIKFSRPGGVVTLRCTLDQGAGRVLVTCQDRGIGIPAADQGQLFTRFYRASNAQDQAIPGTGLGLTIVKQIVEDHGGELRLTSVEGEGTTVVMDLPLFA
ncbi:MAG: GAF domain-containing protein, partial [Actinomycetales bacterium]|nr:GAF domain-containing protein [Actinomycetales bacterium]